MLKIEQYLTNSVAQNEALNERRENQLKELEHDFLERFEAETSAFREQENNLKVTIEEQTGNVKEELAKESNVREIEVENMKSCLEVLYL